MVQENIEKLEELCSCGCGGSLDANSENPCLCEDCNHELMEEELCGCGCGGSLDTNSDNPCRCEGDCC